MQKSTWLNKTARHLRYTLGADVLAGLIRFTPVFDGTDRPPEVINFAGRDNFIGVGDNNVALLKKLAGLKSGDHVMDIGCAIGRNALALHRAFGDDVNYDGFDIVRYGTLWAQKWCKRAGNGYQFAHADILNSFYNPRGFIQAADYTFPYADATFDCSLATSVYTHMDLASMRRYLSETARVTKAGGRAFFTVFGLDEHSRISMEEARAMHEFPFACDGYHVQFDTQPDIAVLHDVAGIQTMLEEFGAKEVAFYPGYWRVQKKPPFDASEYQDFQDIFVVTF